MRQLRYGVAMSLDGYIARPKGEYDWIPHDPDIDFAEIFSRFDTLLMGRRTFEAMRKSREVTEPEYSGGAYPGTRTVVVSTTLRADQHADVTVINDHVAEGIGALKAQPGKDIWLFGGGALFRSCLELGLVDGLEVAIVPILLGGGIPFLPGLERDVPLRYEKQTVFKQSGIALLQYSIPRRT